MSGVSSITSANQLGRLPQDVLLSIFHRLSIKEIFLFCTTCKQYYAYLGLEKAWMVLVRDSVLPDKKNEFYSLFFKTRKFSTQFFEKFSGEIRQVKFHRNWILMHFFDEGLKKIDRKSAQEISSEFQKCTNLLKSDEDFYIYRIGNEKFKVNFFKDASSLKIESSSPINILQRWKDFVFTGSADSSIRKWNLSTGKETSQAIHGAAVTYMDIYEDKVYSGCFQGVLNVWDCQTLKWEKTIQTVFSISVLAHTKDYLIVGSNTGNLQFWKTDLNDSKAFKTLFAHDRKRIHTILTFDKQVWSCGSDGTIYVWELTDIKSTILFDYETSFVCKQLHDLAIVAANEKTDFYFPNGVLFKSISNTLLFRAISGQNEEIVSEVKSLEVSQEQIVVAYYNKKTDSSFLASYGLTEHLSS